ncbi:Trp biosynthesis-associated membrane protein [Branchiibius sp. NY16-3462-2]|uniref:Trp biosynthesis-associated membrane protein n=1 Tax=Branchiibius sp. NY16-3462-2 TaxID=1807500 RepID=UPI000791DB96|nr:Trp biosynthesis-associated membrane protein [Branchiibius sp. NY16-3462-2]KYH44323.1 hypothetical protein AZH51_07220 [Branchiibius sp. NY16-3462-2]
MKRLVFLVIALAVAVLMFAATRTWVTGTVSDAVLSDVKVSVAGSSAAPGVFAAALVGAAAGIVALTAGRIARWIAAVFVLLSGVLALIAVVLVVANPDGPVSDQAAATTGRTGSVAAHGTLTPWVWLALAAAVLLVAAGVLTLVAVRQWGGLSGRYDAPAVRAETPLSDWDKLSAGLDPTAERDDTSA